VRVRAGDSLWLIAVRHLGPGASDERIAATWPRWYAANRDVIGDDPSLIRPGEQLRPPTAPPTPQAQP
jgi:nucleoid-associated protein YgaU